MFYTPGITEYEVTQYFSSNLLINITEFSIKTPECQKIDTYEVTKTYLGSPEEIEFFKWGCLSQPCNKIVIQKNAFQSPNNISFYVIAKDLRYGFTMYSNKITVTVTVQEAFTNCATDTITLVSTQVTANERKYSFMPSELVWMAS